MDKGKNNMALVRVKDKFQVTLPNKVRELAGVSVGDYLEARIGRKGVITLVPQSFIDRSIAEGLADAKAGRTYGPFSNGAEMGASIEANIKKLRAAKKTKRA